MRFSFWPSPTQPWSEVLQLARHVESKGWHGIWYADHFMPNEGDVSTPWNEAWTTIAALAAAVPRLRIGPLVTGNTYRHPAVLAKMASTVDHVSGGRLVLGLGAGWQENEHRAYGIEFSTVRGRLERLEEACQVIKALFSGSRANFEGKYYQLTDAPLEPRPVQQPLPLLIGGGGEKVTLRIAAKYAEEWNYWGDPATIRHKMSVLDRHCEELRRDPRSIWRSAQSLLYLSDDPEFLAKVRGRPGFFPMMTGGVEQIRAVVKEYADAGLDELIVPDFNLGPRQRKIETLDRFMEEVAPVAA
ncbi:MAG TPA: LLM class F420-dependent oxidoreductase [Thermoanaerobaculia bacterium]|nr:LLM class F420-dependent oxidoreductase [Thermoanaerobaculia bacterium]